MSMKHRIKIEDRLDLRTYGASDQFSAIQNERNANFQKEMVQKLSMSSMSKDDDELYHNIESLLKTVEKTLGMRGTTEDYKCALNIHDQIEVMFLKDPEAFRSVLYDVNQSRAIFQREPLSLAATQSGPTPRPS